MNQQALLTDIRLREVDARALSIYRVQTRQQRQVQGRRGRRVRDFASVSGRDNLLQAVALRLLTPRGELAALAHPEYGSRLAELIGTPRTETSRNMAKLYIIEALKQEPRIAEILQVEVQDHPGDRHRIDVALQVRSIDATGKEGADVLNLGPFTLELG